MSATRFGIPFLIIAVLTLLALQNWSSRLPIVLLGTLQTQSLPLGLWLIGAIAAGGLTTLIIAALIGLSRPGTPPRRQTGDPKSPNVNSDSTPNHRPFTANPFSGHRFNANPFSPNRGNHPQPPTVSSRATSSSPAPSNANRASESVAAPSPSAKRRQQDWGSGTSDDWNDWGESTSTSDRQTDRQANAPSDRQDFSREPGSDPFRAIRRDRTTRAPKHTRDRDDRDRESGREPRQNRESPRSSSARTEFESRREPITRNQTGSVYSYTYRPDQESDRVSDRKSDANRTSDRTQDRTQDRLENGTAGSRENVYDAEYRVLIPPYQSDAAPEPDLPPEFLPERQTEPQAPRSKDEEDWGFDFDEEDLDEAQQALKREQRRQDGNF